MDVRATTKYLPISQAIGFAVPADAPAENKAVLVDAFKKAIEVDQDYARSYIGLGSVYMNRAADLVNSALQPNQPVVRRKHTHTSP